MSGWEGQAACRGMDPAVFIVTPKVQQDAAKAICASCPVAGECLEYALSLPAAHVVGVWAGTTGRDRIKLRAGRGVVRRCAHCDVQFETVNTREKMCSDACRSERRAAQQFEYEQRTGRGKARGPARAA